MKVAIVLVVKNEQHDIAEWIAYHIQLGFDTLIVLDDTSTDDTFAVNAAASRFYDIRLFQGTVGPAYDSQIVSYNWACERYKDEFDWLLFIDSDEFLLLKHADQGVKSFLGRFDGWSGIGVNWAIFGSNGHLDRPSGLVIESFTRRSGPDFFPNRHIKSFVRPSKVICSINCHQFNVVPSANGTYCDPSGTALSWFKGPNPADGVAHGLTRDPPDYLFCQLNHYFVRSRAHWKAKIERGYPAGRLTRSENDFLEHDRNEIEDVQMLKYADRVRAMTAHIYRYLSFPPGERA